MYRQAQTHIPIDRSTPPINESVGKDGVVAIWWSLLMYWVVTIWWVHRPESSITPYFDKVLRVAAPVGRQTTGVRLSSSPQGRSLQATIARFPTDLCWTHRKREREEETAGEERGRISSVYV